jgi:prefoldin subunit 5
MDSKEQMIREISSVVESLSLKIEALQAKVNELCKSTGDCTRVKKVNKDLLPPSQKDKH